MKLKYKLKIGLNLVKKLGLELV